VRWNGYSLVKERPPRQTPRSDRRERKTRIYNHWRRCAFDEAAAHRRRANPPPRAKNRELISGFFILRVSRQPSQKRRK